jgi:DNA-binding NtrC family response regulator
MNLHKKVIKGIIVLDSNKASSSQTSEMITSYGYPVAVTTRLSALVNLIESNRYLAVIIDIDSVSVKNRTIRDLALKYPGFFLLCTSKDRFHPELKEAICYHIYACLNKPIDPDELIYWIKSIYEENNIPDI